MATVSTTYVLYPTLGSAVWTCETESKRAWGNFSATGIEKSSTSPITLKFKHIFFSLKKTPLQNDALITKLAAILATVGAKGIEATVDYNLFNCQQIDGYYYIENILPDQVDQLTTAIAAETTKIILELAK